MGAGQSDPIVKFWLPLFATKGVSSLIFEASFFLIF